ncbi:Hypothetical protein A7982_05266 [Minicystis rosea]|nr:Hypothetical protein A7982_05266 [Minicystis rosea]
MGCLAAALACAAGACKSDRPAPPLGGGTASAPAPPAADADTVIVAELIDKGPRMPDCGTLHGRTVMQYEAKRVIRGTLQRRTDVFVIQGCPELSRKAYGGDGAGDLDAFRNGDWHLLSLRRATPDEFAQATNPFPAMVAPRFVALRTDRADRTQDEAPPPAPSFPRNDPTPIPSSPRNDPPPIGNKPAGPSAAAALPIGYVSVGDSTITGNIPSALAAVAGMVGDFRTCYGLGLVTEPKMEGSMIITALVNGKGEVTSATPSAVKGISGAVAACIASRVAAWGFAPPGAGSGSVTIPMKLTLK